MMSDSVSISVNSTCAPPCLYVCKNSVSMGAKHANSARKFPDLSEYLLADPGQSMDEMIPSFCLGTAVK